MTTKRKSKTIRVDVSCSVHDRLLKFGHTFPQRVNTLLACREVVLKAVRKPIGLRKGVHITYKAHADLLIAQQTLGCMSLSNVLESLLNTNPSIPVTVELINSLDNMPVNASVRVKAADHAGIKAIADKEGIPMWLAVHNILVQYQKGTQNES